MTYSKLPPSRRLLVEISSLSNLHSDNEVVSPEVRIGPNYQVEVPEFEYNHHDPADYNDDSILIWQPNERVDDRTLDNYLNEVKHKYGCESLQALAVLFQSDYNIEDAINKICQTSG